MENETFRRCSYELHDASEFCMESGFEIISFVIDCLGPWNISFYLGPFGF